MMKSLSSFEQMLEWIGNEETGKEEKALELLQQTLPHQQQQEEGEVKEVLLIQEVEMDPTT